MRKTSSKLSVSWLAAAAITIMTSACGGGGGSSSDTPQPPVPPPPPPSTGSVELNWAAPIARSNGDAMADSERGDYLILYFREDELDSSQALWSAIDSLNTFKAGGSEIAYFVRPEQLGDILNGGNNNVQVASTASSHTFDDLSAGTYYFSIAARDSDGQFAYLSNTVSATIP